ncbi:hypothetical protein [Yersinia aleksiciae]|nr:hypothetical protein [Yersinia aleksiciae]
MENVINKTDKGEIIIGQINNPRLMPNMRRCRSGKTQQFGERVIEGGKLIQECDFSIEPAEKHIYALEINGVWMWVNGCAHCNQNGEKMSYQVCDEHDRCQSCNAQRKNALGIPPRDEHDSGGGMWATVTVDGTWGWTCNSCYEKQVEEIRATAIARIPNDEDFDEWDFKYQSNAKCPYCSAEVDTSDRYDSDEESIECCECGNSFKLTANHEVTWTTEREA